MSRSNHHVLLCIIPLKLMILLSSVLYKLRADRVLAATRRVKIGRSWRIRDLTSWHVLCPSLIRCPRNTSGTYAINVSRKRLAGHFVCRGVVFFRVSCCVGNKSATCCRLCYQHHMLFCPSTGVTHDRQQDTYDMFYIRVIYHNHSLVLILQ